MPRRKIIQVATMPATPSNTYQHEQPSTLYALCDDGTLWAVVARSRWTRVKDIPDTDDDERS